MTETEAKAEMTKWKSLEIEDFLPEWVREFKKILEEAEKARR